MAYKNPDDMRARMVIYNAGRKEAMKAYHLVHIEERRVASRAKKVAWKRRTDALKSGGCVECGSLQDLHFHHVDPATKLFKISAMYKRSETVKQTELKKCIVLCYRCHTLVHKGGHYVQSPKFSER